jgi:hypothetical protein
VPLSRPTLTENYPVEVGTDGSSPRETFAPDQTTAVRRWKVLHDERLMAVPWFVGYAELYRAGGPGTTVTRLERLTPKQYLDASVDEGVTPDDAAVSGMYAVAVPEITQHKATGKNLSLKSAGEGTHARYSESVLSVQYEHVPFNVLEDSLVPAAEEWRRCVWLKDATHTMETLTLPGGTRRFMSNTGGAGTSLGTIPYGTVIYIPITRYVLAWELLPAELYQVGSTTPTAWQKRVWGWPADTIKPLVGRVNSADWLAWPKGELLLESVKPIQRKHPTIGLSWTMEVTYAHNPKGWLNAYYIATTTGTSGWYYASSYPYSWYDVPNSPDDHGLYNVGQIWRVFDPTG